VASVALKLDIPGAGLAQGGPVTRARLRRSRLAYVILCAVGTLPWALDASPALQLLGWGAWLPGMGFVALGGWWLLAFLLTVVLFAAAFFAWFGSGMIVAPALIWAGSAVVAAAIGGQPAPYAPYLVPGLSIAYLAIMALRRHKRAGEIAERREQRQAILPRGLAALRAAAVPAPALDQRELSEFDLSLMRYSLDRSLQPIGKLNGFDRVDQFQTSALRYQLNMLGYGLGAVQRHYLPNFHGYVSEAQRRLIEQYMQKDIWSYWKLENAWGNLSLRGDPARKDNIMLTGYLPINALLYQNNTGDDRYAKAGGLTFRDSDSDAYRHDVHTVIDSLLENFNGRWKGEFCLFPCEPNWIYPACNFRGLTSLRLYDTVFGTDHFDKLAGRFRASMEQEFIRADGSMVQLRSKLTGHEMPFPASDAVVIKMLNPLYPDLAENYWAICREEEIYTEAGQMRARIPEKALDFGNYKPGNLFAYDGLLGSAGEMGDRPVVDTVRQMLLDSGKIVRKDGVTSFAGSNFCNASLIESWLGVAGGWRQAITTRPTDAALKGPVLAEAAYPDILVAHASSGGDDLRLILHPGLGAGSHRISLGRLVPQRAYRVVETGQAFCADSAGEARIEVVVDGRTPLHIVPA
jgi:hypothetical protein